MENRFKSYYTKKHGWQLYENGKNITKFIPMDRRHCSMETEQRDVAYSSEGYSYSVKKGLSFFDWSLKNEWINRISKEYKDRVDIYAAIQKNDFIKRDCSKYKPAKLIEACNYLGVSSKGTIDECLYRIANEVIGNEDELHYGAYRTALCFGPFVIKFEKDLLTYCEDEDTLEEYDLSDEELDSEYPIFNIDDIESFSLYESNEQTTEEINAFKWLKRYNLHKYFMPEIYAYSTSQKVILMERVLGLKYESEVFLDYHREYSYQYIFFNTYLDDIRINNCGVNDKNRLVVLDLGAGIRFLKSFVEKTSRRNVIRKLDGRKDHSFELQQIVRSSYRHKLYGGY